MMNIYNLFWLKWWCHPYAYITISSSLRGTTNCGHGGAQNDTDAFGIARQLTAVSVALFQPYCWYDFRRIPFGRMEANNVHIIIRTSNCQKAELRSKLKIICTEYRLLSEGNLLRKFW